MPQASAVPNDSLVYMVQYPDAVDVPIRYEWIMRKDLQGYILCGCAVDPQRKRAMRVSMACVKYAGEKQTAGCLEALLETI